MQLLQLRVIHRLQVRNVSATAIVRMCTVSVTFGVRARVCSVGKCYFSMRQLHSIDFAVKPGADSSHDVQGTGCCESPSPCCNLTSTL